MVQNKIRYDVHGHTAAKLIIQRADATKDNMGLTTFEGAKVCKKGVDIAKNYLSGEEISELTLKQLLIHFRSRTILISMKRKSCTMKFI